MQAGGIHRGVGEAECCDEQEYCHSCRTEGEKLTASDTVDENHGDDHRNERCERADHGDVKRLLFRESHGTPQAGIVVENHVDAAELLGESHEDANPDNLLQTESASEQIGKLRRGLVADGFADLTYLILRILRAIDALE